MAIPVVIETEVYQGKSSRSANFGMEFSAKLARTLSSTLYDYKIEACIREYATNVTDSHNDSGKRGLAGYIHLPTKMEPWYEAEDFGLGMTEDTIYSIFTVYGKSTKEGNNSTNGNLGFGSKCGFSVGGQFTVTSMKDGIKTVVVCYKDKSGVPAADTKSITKTTEGNGTRIRVPVNTKDISAWQLNGAKVLGAFEVPHKVNSFGLYGAEYEATREICNRARQEGSIYLDSNSLGEFEHRDTRFVLMGDVLYAVPSWKDLVRVTGLKDVSHTMTDSGVYITHFPIGSLDFAPSRETISLDEQTFSLLSKRVTSDVIKYYRTLMSEVTNEDSSSWYLFYKKFYGTTVWSALADYKLPFTDGWTLHRTTPNNYSYNGTFTGNKIHLVPKDFKLSGLVPPNKKGIGGTAFNTSVEWLHQERLSRMDNVVLVYSDKEEGLNKKKEVLQLVNDKFPDSNAILYCQHKTMLNNVAKWFGVPPERTVCGDEFVPVKVRKVRAKGSSRGGFGITEDFYTVATTLTQNGQVHGKVDLSEDGIFYVDGKLLEVQGYNTVHTFSDNSLVRKLPHLDTLGINKVIVANKNNIGKIKRNGVPCLSKHLSSLVKKKVNTVVKCQVASTARLGLDYKQKAVADKVKGYTRFNKHLDKLKKDNDLATAILSISDFGVGTLPKYKEEKSKLTTLRTAVFDDLHDIKQRLPLWDSISNEDDFNYYLKLEKFIK